MKRWFIFILLSVVVGIPFVLKRDDEVALKGDRTLVIITPHNEAIRYEFGHGFRDWYKEKTGQDVAIDWRVVGGTSEIARFVSGEYTAAFRNYWEHELNRPWSDSVQRAFGNRRIKLDDSPKDDTEEEAARRAFLNSEVSCGIDIFFGGGTYDHNKQAQIGNTVTSRVLAEHPDWFGPEAIPHKNSGETYWESEGRWFGAALSAYGMIYNKDALKRLGIEGKPEHWWDLADPRLVGEVAVCDPTKSGSITQAFEMIVQEQIQIRLAQLKEAGVAEDAVEAQAVREGWANAMRLIRKISANAQYFTDSSMKPSIDVSIGQAAIGMTIDFYGQFQVESVEMRGGASRLGFSSPEGGTTISADPISLLRGAENLELAELFIEYVLSEDGQKRWSYKASDDVAGAPKRYSLRRTAIRKDFYTEEHFPYMSEPDYLPYERSKSFRYHSEWTGHLFSEIRFLIKVMAMDDHEALKSAWHALIENDFPPEATALFEDVSLMDYDVVMEDYAPIVGGRDPIAEVKLARNLGGLFRDHYRKVEELAKAGK